MIKNKIFPLLFSDLSLYTFTITTIDESTLQYKRQSSELWQTRIVRLEKNKIVDLPKIKNKN